VKAGYIDPAIVQYATACIDTDQKTQKEKVQRLQIVR